MYLVFVDKSGGPERLVAEAEIVFEEGALTGLRLVGFSIWRSVEGGLHATFPARSFGAGTDRRFYDFLRAVDGSPDHVRRVKAWIVAEYARQAAPGALRA